MMDWMHTYKTTDTSTAHLWKIIKLLVPHDVDIRTFNTIKTILRKHEESVVEVIYIFVSLHFVLIVRRFNIFVTYKSNIELICDETMT